MRIAVGGISHETSTFAKTPTTLLDFEQGFGLYRGVEVVERFRGANICTGGFLDGAEKHGFEAVPLLWTFAYPSGLVERATYDALRGEFIERLKSEDAQSRLDGALLDLHGAMVVEGIDDADGDIIAAVRAALGDDRPVIATTDLHANHTAARVAAADAIIGFDTYPHVDMAERGREAADIIVATIRAGLRPTAAIKQLPIMWSASQQVTAHEPMSAAFRQVHEMETRPGIISITLSTGFPWADIPEMGPSVIAIADGDAMLARQTADELAEWIWERRQQWYRDPPTVAEGLAEGERVGRFPIMLADQADNTGGGSPGDSTEILQTFIDRNLQDALVLYIVDPEVAELAHAQGVGAKLAVPLGGKSVPVQGPPVEAEWEVVSLSDGKFAYDGPMYAGLTGNMGASAWLRSGGVSVVVVTAREQPLDPAFARSLGIDCAAQKYIAVKSAVHFRSGFEKIAGSIHTVAARAIHNPDFRKVVYTRRTRKVFPLDLS